MSNTLRACFPCKSPAICFFLTNHNTIDPKPFRDCILPADSWCCCILVCVRSLQQRAARLLQLRPAAGASWLPSRVKHLPLLNSNNPKTPTYIPPGLFWVFFKLYIITPLPDLQLWFLVLPAWISLSYWKLLLYIRKRKSRITKVFRTEHFFLLKRG